MSWFIVGVNFELGLDVPFQQHLSHSICAIPPHSHSHSHRTCFVPRSRNPVPPMYSMLLSAFADADDSLPREASLYVYIPYTPSASPAPMPPVAVCFALTARFTSAPRSFHRVRSAPRDDLAAVPSSTGASVIAYGV